MDELMKAWRDGLTSDAECLVRLLDMNMDKPGWLDPKESEWYINLCEVAGTMLKTETERADAEIATAPAWKE